MVGHESERLITLTTNILRLSKLDNQAIQSAASRFSLDEQIRQAVLVLQPKWSAKNIALDIDLEPHSFEGDEELIAHIWVNLLDNAVKFSHDNGVISVRLRESEGSLRVDVADNGIGMDTDMKTHSFDQFYQGNTSLSKEGSGLGLSIVKRIVDMYNGRIDVDSEPGKGARFSVSLPLSI